MFGAIVTAFDTIVDVHAEDVSFASCGNELPYFIVFYADTMSLLLHLVV